MFQPACPGLWSSRIIAQKTFSVSDPKPRKLHDKKNKFGPGNTSLRAQEFQTRACGVRRFTVDIPVRGFIFGEIFYGKSSLH